MQATDLESWLRVIYLGERELVLFCLQNSDRGEDIPYYYYGNYSNYETDEIAGQYDYGSNGNNNYLTIINYN